MKRRCCLTRRLKPGMDASSSFSVCRLGVELWGWTTDDGIIAASVEMGLLPDVVTLTDSGELPDVPDDGVPLLLTNVSPANTQNRMCTAYLTAPRPCWARSNDPQATTVVMVSTNQYDDNGEPKFSKSLHTAVSVCGCCGDEVAAADGNSLPRCSPSLKSLKVWHRRRRHRLVTWRRLRCNTMFRLPPQHSFRLWHRVPQLHLFYRHDSFT